MLHYFTDGEKQYLSYLLITFRRACLNTQLCVICFVCFLSFTGNPVCKWQSNLCMMRKYFFIMDFQICWSNRAPAAPSLTPAGPKSSSIDVMAKNRLCNLQLMKEMLEADMRKQQTGASGWTTRFVFFTLTRIRCCCTFSLLRALRPCFMICSVSHLSELRSTQSCHPISFLKIWNKCMGWFFFFFFSSNVCDEMCFVDFHPVSWLLWSQSGEFGSNQSGNYFFKKQTEVYSMTFLTTFEHLDSYQEVWPTWKN